VVVLAGLARPTRWLRARRIQPAPRLVVAPDRRILRAKSAASNALIWSDGAASHVNPATPWRHLTVRRLEMD
jgi:hypothetical protein